MHDKLDIQSMQVALSLSFIVFCIEMRVFEANVISLHDIFIAFVDWVEYVGSRYYRTWDSSLVHMHTYNIYFVIQTWKIQFTDDSWILRIRRWRRSHSAFINAASLLFSNAVCRRNTIETPTISIMDIKNISINLFKNITFVTPLHLIIRFLP